ncbi:hypothetical protein RSAG8_07012, partial [Rhizoctonia solani AG-8 WAC10335]
MSCPACGSHSLHFDNEVLCLLCTSCGNIVESDQSALDFSMTTEKGTVEGTWAVTPRKHVG